jgi:hypothetical protein
MGGENSDVYPYSNRPRKASWMTNYRRDDSRVSWYIQEYPYDDNGSWTQNHHWEPGGHVFSSEGDITYTFSNMLCDWAEIHPWMTAYDFEERVELHELSPGFETFHIAPNQISEMYYYYHETKPKISVWFKLPYLFFKK